MAIYNVPAATFRQASIAAGGDVEFGCGKIGGWSWHVGVFCLCHEEDSGTNEEDVRGF